MLYDKYYPKTPEYPNQNVASEATARLPYALFGPTIVTHFPLFDRNEEANLFEIDEETNRFRRRRKQIDDLLVALLDDKLPLNLTDGVKERLERSNRDKEEIIELATKQIWKACLDGVRYIEKEKPQLLVFNAKTLISLEINRYVHNVVATAIVSGSKPWTDRLLRSEAFGYTNSILFVVLEELDRHLDKAAQAPEAVSTASKRDKRTPPDLRENSPIMRLGGFISWYNATDVLKNGRIHGTNLEARNLYPHSEKHVHWLNRYEAIIDRYLVWRRGDRNWQYTFCEGIFNYLAGSDNDGGDGGRIGDCLPQLRRFIERLLSSRTLSKVFPDVPDFPSPAAAYPFPGFRTAGAQYYVIPAELLLFLAARLKDLPDSLKATVVHDVDFKLNDEIGLSDYLKRLYALDTELLGSTGVPLRELVRDCPSNVDEERFATELKRIRGRLRALRKKASGPLAKEDLPGQLSLKLTSDGIVNPNEEELNQLLAAIAEFLWKCVYSDKGKTSSGRSGSAEFPEHNIGQEDFVSSAVIDGRALYFSNFRPYGEEKFTRTFFIDLGLTPYQRGRLVRRLCEIATYRMSCVKDLSLFHALQDGINHLNKEFSQLVSNVPVNESIEDTRKVLADTLSLYRRAIGFEMFISEGVTGRRRAAEGDWERVKKQVNDIRERRVAGYAQLGEFLERGLAVAVLDISRVADQYENLLERIRDLLSALRTRSAGDTSHEVLAAVNRIQRVTSIHTVILLITTLLGCIGAMYYAFGLMKYATDEIMFRRFVIVGILLLILLVLAATIVTMWQERRMIGRWIRRWRVRRRANG